LKIKFLNLTKLCKIIKNYANDCFNRKISCSVKLAIKISVWNFVVLVKKIAFLFKNIWKDNKFL